MYSLDNVQDMALVDKSGMISLIVGLPDQCRVGLEIGRAFVPPAAWSPSSLANVIVTGLGASGGVGDILQGLLSPNCEIPVIVNRDYGLPAFARQNSLVVSVSYSGNTEETLSAFAQAEAQNCKLIALSSGGELLRRANIGGIPQIIVPGGQPARSAIGYMFFALWGALQQLGLVPVDESETDEALKIMERQRDAFRSEIPESNNSAKKLARELNGKLPLIYGSHDFRRAIANRWRTQFNENAKIHAFSSSFPEINHNEMLGWVNAVRQGGDWAVVMIRDRNDTARISSRVDITRKLIGSEVPVYEIYADGESSMARLWSGIYFGDFVSLYLALLWDEDPSSSRMIDSLNEQLATAQ
jgi:glucose/mannose-6-phosphate isomerase